nr:DegT/DnrJ/EryC1/StrS family aminotransferase [Candidatus Njordarchaeum guaymaensis]
SCGNASLHVSLLASGIGLGDEVIVPDLTFWAGTASPVLMVGATPIIVDVNPETYALDVGKLEESITDKTRAVMPVYSNGTCPDMDEIIRLAKEHDLVMIEDCARAHGFVWKDKPAGSIGDMGCFSFQQSKFMTAGEGGIIVTNSQVYKERCHAIKDCGRERERDLYSAGVTNWWNFRMTQFQAAILLIQLERLEEQLERRQANSEYLDKVLDEIEGIQPILVDHRLTRHQPWPYVFKYNSDYFNKAEIDTFIAALRGEGIPCSRMEPPLHLSLDFPEGSAGHKLYVEKKEEARAMFPVSEKAYYEEAVCLPQNLFLAKKEDMDDITEAIRKIQRYSDKL